MERQGNRIMAVRDGRNPYGSRGGYVVSSRGRRGRRGGRRDRGMDYADQDMRMRDYGDMARDYRGGSRMDRGDYNQDMRGYDRASQDYNYGEDMGMDGHYGRQGGYEPVEFMGYCSGYYGSPNQDYGYDMRGRGRDYGYDMRGRGGRGRDYGYDYGNDYGDYGDYGETLSDKELEEWCHKLKSKLTDQEKQIFSKESIAQRSKAMGRPMEGFGEKELEVVTLMLLDDYKRTLGANPDTMIKLAFDWLDDKDAKIKGAEKLAVYHDDIVMGGED